MKLIYKCICLVLGAVLGAGCDSDSGPDDPVEYGMPHGTLRIDGHVRDEQGQPIAGIQVFHYDSRPDTTDAQGAWSIEDDYASVPCTAGDSLRCSVRASDIDGEANGGSYDEALHLLDLTQTQEGSGWYEGAFEEHDIDLVMPRQEGAPKKDEPRR